MYGHKTTRILNDRAAFEAATAAEKKAQLARAQNHPLAPTLEADAIEKRAEYNAIAEQLKPNRVAVVAGLPESVTQRAKELAAAH